MSSSSEHFGREFEKTLRNKLRVLAQQRVVGRWQKNEPAWALRGKGPPPRFEPQYVRTSATGADFEGHLGRATSRPGLAWAIECKSTGPTPEGELREFCREERITDLQIEHLDSVHADGGVALLLLQFRPVDEPWLVAAIPWGTVPWRKAKTRSYVSIDAAKPFRVSIEHGLAAHFFVDDDPL